MAVVKKLKVRILEPVAGKWFLSASPGDVVEYSKAFAEELVESKYAEFVSKIKK